jgi:actin-related protein 5
LQFQVLIYLLINLFFLLEMSELLFEAYDVPGVVYGVDALFSLQYSQPQCQDSLVLRLGHQCCHVIPLLDGQVRSENTRRVNLGGFHITNYLHRLLQLRHSMLAPAISLSRVEVNILNSKMLK